MAVCVTRGLLLGTAAAWTGLLLFLGTAAAWTGPVGAIRPISVLGRSLQRVSVGTRAVVVASPIDGEFARVAAMRVGDIKAELEMRGVDFSGCFEKDDLVRRLVLARQQGEADPSIVDKFNTDTLERSFRKDENSEDGEEADPFAAAAAEGIDMLPGGMSPEMVKKLASNPELMAVLQNPKMQAVLKDVMESGPVAFQKHIGDSEVMSMIAIFQKAVSS